MKEHCKPDNRPEYFNLATYIPEKLTVYEMLTELNLEQLNEMKEMVEEVKLNKLKDKYFREDLDELNNNETFYRWEFNECYDEGAEQLWYECKDYLHDGCEIVLHRDFRESHNKWTVQFKSIQMDYSEYVANTEHYLKDVNDFIVQEEDVNEIVKHAENYIRENKEKLKRVQ